MMWSFNEAIKQDKKYHKFGDDELAAEQDIKAQLTLEQRIKAKLEEYDIDLSKLVSESKDKEVVEIVKNHAKGHYDKEDLISFH